MACLENADALHEAEDGFAQADLLEQTCCTAGNRARGCDCLVLHAPQEDSAL